MKELDNVTDIGSVDDYSDFPAEVLLDNTPYWLVRAPEGGYRLLLAICPHAGGEIRPMNDVLFCPLHFWTFDSETGACVNVPGERLMSRNVIVRDRRLIAEGPLV
ncbi:Rieske (2Fe-2S) protein [Cohnella terricola]|uniref:Rieske (2Fe-2S) protein n=1 Tax=Cohnella terricola TaxID=1289167 RepID=A0A559J9F6_9BACL|nr:Rieske (2Fe-2S) protein [Cohnella terricola]TVX96501.1 Rieske (2Fe-2S) protein [Cohnella terricola]